jgi:hypothetical protein
LEGSFGNEKNHYLLDKIKARNKQTEIFWILFGVMTAKSVLMGRRIAMSKKTKICVDTNKLKRYINGIPSEEWKIYHSF